MQAIFNLEFKDYFISTFHSHDEDDPARAENQRALFVDPIESQGLTLSQLYRIRYLTVIVSRAATYASRRGIIISIVYGVADYGTGDVTIESYGGGIRGNRQNLHRAEQLHAANARRCKRAATCMRD